IRPLNGVKPASPPKPAVLPKQYAVGPIRTIDGKTGPFSCVAFAPDCRRALAAGEKDFTLRLWDLEEGKEIVRLEGHTARVLGLTISPDGKRALSGSMDFPGVACLWDL